MCTRCPIRTYPKPHEAGGGTEEHTNCQAGPFQPSPRPYGRGFGEECAEPHHQRLQNHTTRREIPSKSQAASNGPMPWSTRVIILIRFTPMQPHWGCSSCPRQGRVFLADIWGDTELAQALSAQAKLLHANKIFTPHHLALGNIYLYSLCGNSKVVFFFKGRSM